MEYETLSKIFYKDSQNYENRYRSRFNSESSYKYDFYIGEDQVFVCINLELMNLSEEIHRLDKKILWLCEKRIPLIALNQLIKKCIINEIQLTNEIEGVHSTRKEIREIIGDDKFNKKRNRLYGLVQKYLLLLKNEQIALQTCQDIRTLYNEFVLSEIKESNPENAPDGSIFRKEIVEILSPSQKVIHKGVYPEQKIVEMMTEVLKILDGKGNHLINIAVFHYMFGYIHPFYDGNGRMSRFISSYLLTKELQGLIGINLSYIIKNNLNKYYDMFKDANDYRNKGDLTPFVIRFLEFIREAGEFVGKSIEDKAEKLDFYSKKIDACATSKNNDEVLQLLLKNALFADEGLNIEEIAYFSEMGKSTVRGVLKEISGELLIVDSNNRMKLYSLNLDELAKI